MALVELLVRARAPYSIGAVHCTLLEPSELRLVATARRNTHRRLVREGSSATYVVMHSMLTYNVDELPHQEHWARRASTCSPHEPLLHEVLAPLLSAVHHRRSFQSADLQVLCIKSQHAPEETHTHNVLRATNQHVDTQPGPAAQCVWCGNTHLRCSGNASNTKRRLAAARTLARILIRSLRVIQGSCCETPGAW